MIIMEWLLQSKRTTGNINLHNSHTGCSFVAFVCYSFGALGPSAFRYLAVLAMLDLHQHETVRSLQVMDLLDASNIGPVVSGLALVALLLLW